MAARWPARSVACRASMASCECPVAGGTGPHPSWGPISLTAVAFSPPSSLASGLPCSWAAAGHGRLRPCPGLSLCRVTEQINLLPQSLLPSGSLSLMSRQLWLGLLEALILWSFPLFFPISPIPSPPKPRGGTAKTRAAEVPRACHQQGW